MHRSEPEVIGVYRKACTENGWTDNPPVPSALYAVYLTGLQDSPDGAVIQAAAELIELFDRNKLEYARILEHWDGIRGGGMFAQNAFKAFGERAEREITSATNKLREALREYGQSPAKGAEQ